MNAIASLEKAADPQEGAALVLKVYGVDAHAI